MKKINKNVQVPSLLEDYINQNPNDDWEQFRNNGGDGFKEVKRQILADQRHLCAYCEIDLADYQGQGLDDFRIDHFHPKKPHMPPINHALDWQNLRGVCSGGNVRYIGDASRFTQPDYCCDEPKGNNNWVGQILDPLNDIPAFPPLFLFNELGKMEVAPDCPPHLHIMAQQSMDRLRLSPDPSKNRDSPRLVRFRKAVLDSLREQLLTEMNNGNDLEQALDSLSRHYFSINSLKWPAFFSTIRWYLGAAAESQLHAIGYDG